MNKKSLLPYLFIFGLFLLVFAGCKDDDEDDTLYMSGTLSFNLPNYAFPGDSFLVEASGITAPQGDSVVYTFKGEYFTPDSVVAKSFQVKVPETTGSYSMTLLATAEGYSSSSNTRTLKVIPEEFLAMVQGFDVPDDSIADPRDNKIYYYRSYGNLDWFVQNLDWRGAGITYSNEEALGYMTGSLYTWNQALTGEDAPSSIPAPVYGLGQGPRGVCPPGWHVPTPEDWADLASAVSGTHQVFLDPWSGLAEGFSLDATVNGNKIWKYHPDNEKTNTTGWNALPAGYASMSGTDFEGFGQTAFWWSTGADGSQGYYRFIHYAIDRFSYASTDKSAVYASVRCVRTTGVGPQTNE
ncbi:MAG: fibrobacter succinogenes major paralogous domain-containing protein [Bacteroidales bacterium]|nr:fibrobacter succinogenes major paralogous domain-containing protein [Bacteroidales bacterium]